MMTRIFRCCLVAVGMVLPAMCVQGQAQGPLGRGLGNGRTPVAGRPLPGLSAGPNALLNRAVPNPPTLGARRALAAPLPPPPFLMNRPPIGPQPPLLALPPQITLGRRSTPGTTANVPPRRIFGAGPGLGNSPATASAAPRQAQRQDMPRTSDSGVYRAGEYSYQAARPTPAAPSSVVPASGGSSVAAPQANASDPATSSILEVETLPLPPPAE